VPQEDMMQAITSVGPREMTSRDVLKEIRNKESNLAVRLDGQYSKLLVSALPLEATLRRGPSRSGWNRRINLMGDYAKELEIAGVYRKDRSLSIYRLEYYKKFSIPFGAFSFIFLAVPLGLMAKKSGQTVGFLFGSFISVIYWALLLGGQTLGINRGYSPFLSMWIPNILAISVGLVFCVQRIRR
jgi:lipopolysaccharide export system permease protein